MPRISAKQLELQNQQKQQEELMMQRNTIECSNFLMRILGLETDSSGFITRFDDEDNSVSAFVFDGKKCKNLNYPINMRTELPFDPYNNVKLCCGVLQYYITNYLHRDTNMLFITNRNMNESGNAAVIFDDGSKVEGNTYNKDTLKYIDMILVLDRAIPLEYNTLRQLDIG